MAMTVKLSRRIAPQAEGARSMRPARPLPNRATPPQGCVDSGWTIHPQGDPQGCTFVVSGAAGAAGTTGAGGAADAGIAGLVSAPGATPVSGPAGRDTGDLPIFRAGTRACNAATADCEAVWSWGSPSARDRAASCVS